MRIHLAYWIAGGHRLHHRTPIVLVSLFLLTIGSAAPLHAEDSPLEIPRVWLSGIAVDLGLSKSDVDGAYHLRILRDGSEVLSRSGTLPATVEDLVLPAGGWYEITLEAGGKTWEHRVRALPGIVSILPPVVAILMALLFRQVVIALFTGIWLGAFLVNDLDIVGGIFRVVDHYVVQALAGPGGGDHVSIAVFTLLLGGMVGVFSHIGGTQGVVDEIARIATTARRGQVATWLMGVAIFFDDYTNTLIVGNTMRPITDRLRISREKLAYIVDSTAAPVTVVAVITSWIGFEISLLGDAFATAGIDRNPFTTFVASIQYSFYPILTLAFVLLIAASGRDFGPMRRAEWRARQRGLLMGEKAVPLSNIDKDISFDEVTKARWYNAAIPIAVVVVGTLAGLLITGRNSLLEAGATSIGVMDALRESNSFVALLWSSFAGCVAAILLGVAQRLASLADIMNAWVAGMKSMMTALIILVLAWCIGSVCSDLRTADYLVSTVSGILTPTFLPTLIFLVAAAVSFSTGTSWTTMTILTPITIPLVIRIGELSALPAGDLNTLLLSGIAAIMAGSVFGDHCSPISDTTIMSSMASASDHVDHVRTQLPYALVVAAVAIASGFLLTGMGVPSIVSLVLGLGAVASIVFLVGKPVPDGE